VAPDPDALDPDVRRLLAEPNFAHVATLLPDGAPHSVAVWIGIDRGRPYFFTQAASRKARNLAADPRVALSVVDRRNPYRTGFVRGRVDETVEGDAALTLIDALAHKFTGRAFPMRSGLVFRVAVERSRLVELPFEDRPDG
jgi:PPOX class probable F420-dependent enzyme